MLDEGRRGARPLAQGARRIRGGVARPAVRHGREAVAECVEVDRIRARETRRLAVLIAAYDAACAATVGVFNLHQGAIGERRRLIRAGDRPGPYGVCG